MILSAEEARNRASLNTPTAKLVEDIMKDINARCDEGKFHMTYWPEGENNYTIRHASESLRRLGYVVTTNDEDAGVCLWIDWSK